MKRMYVLAVSTLALCLGFFGCVGTAAASRASVDTAEAADASKPRVRSATGRPVSGFSGPAVF